jgi:hypothetical protein
MGMDDGTLNSLGNGGGWVTVVLSVHVHGVGGDLKSVAKRCVPAKSQISKKFFSTPVGPENNCKRGE